MIAGCLRVGLFALAAWMLVETQVARAQTAAPIDFNRQIKPILSNACFRCHGPDPAERKGGADGLRLDTADGASIDLGGYKAITPGKPGESELINRVKATNADLRMPPPEAGKPLSPREVELLTQWISQGAKYSPHWSYIKPTRPELPTVKNASWPKTGVDRFILSRLEAEGLQPMPEADRYALVRRLSLDLTGLPPTVAEADAFAKDQDPEAYDKLVERLLNKSAYGEHWAHMWLDLARYADSTGYADDKPRTIWMFRDYVIRSLNANKPFDQFTVEQLAGDLLPNPTDEQLIATAFHRNTLTNNEGGTNDEEFRNVAVVDRVNTTLAVWMGTTMACAQCHTHKYDPISQEEYFRFFAVLNSTEDADKGDESPLLSLYTPEETKQRTALQDEIAGITKKLKEPSPELAAGQAKWEEESRTDLNWQVLKPENAATKTGVGTSILEDGSVRLARGSKAETITLAAKVDGLAVKAVRIEVLSDEKIGKNGPGFAEGNFVLSGVKLTQSSDEKDAKAMPIELVAAVADYSQPDFPAESLLNNKDPKNKGWAVGGRVGESHALTLVLKQPLDLLAGVKLAVSLEHQFAQPNFVIGRVRLSVTDREGAAAAGRVSPGIVEVLKIPAAERTKEQLDKLRDHYLAIAPELVPLRKQLADKQKQLADLKPATVPVMKEMAKPRVTKIQHRGNFLDLGKEVTPGVPAAFHQLPDGVKPDRMAVAKWLIDENNPLTARVIANRYWEQVFGIGIVSTSEEFGSQGELPSHPELLDWLATELVRLKWDMKALVKLLVTSAAYRQSSKVTPELTARDPDNRLLARGPRFRLSAEMVRDQALAVSGLLSPRMFGPSVRPPQPNIGLNAAFGGGIDWQTSSGDDKFRRALYTSWRRSNPYPSMSTFDAPNREVCTVRRVRTNTPLQALVTLNDPVYIEAAQALARRIVTEGGTNPIDRARYAFRTCLTRPPGEEEAARIVALYEQTLARYQKDPETARKMATDPIGPAPKELNVPELAAWTLVGNVLLNLDEALMKR